MKHSGRYNLIILMGLTLWFVQTPNLRADDPSQTPTPIPSSSPSPRPLVEIWPEGWVSNGWFLDELDKHGQKLSNVIFDAIDDIKLYDINSEYFSTQFSVHRRIFDNEDILNSWTVVDRFDIDGSIPLYSYALDGLNLGTSVPGNVGFSIGTSQGIELVNIRQVLPRNYALIPPPESLKASIENAPWYKDFTESKPDPSDESEEDGRWVYRLNEAGQRILSFLPSDPENRARYSKFYNLVVFPFRLPLTADLLRNMDNGEIISYQGQGSLQVGASVGWNVDPTGIIGLAQMGLSFSTYIRGSYRISVLKEDERFVKVKVTRVLGRGQSGTIGSEYKQNFLDGIIVIKNLQKQLKITPFNLTINEAIAHTFDVGYRYDLSTPSGREAYEHAVTGRLALSDELASDSFETSGVQKLFTRDADSESRSNKSEVRLGFIFKADTGSTLSTVSSVITLPDGTHHVFSSSAESSDNWRFAWGVYERHQHNFTVNLDLDRYENDQDAFNLMVEGRAEDSDTDDEEMLAYELEVEDSVGKSMIFPRMPPSGNMGRAHFYYRIALKENQINKFIHTPEEQMWPALEKAFHQIPGTWSTPYARAISQAQGAVFALLNVPLYVSGFNIRKGSDFPHAEKIRNRWARLKTITDPKARAEALGKMFFDRIYGTELTYLLRYVLDQEEVFFYATGYSRAFGRIVDQGGSQLHYEDVATRAQREIEFDRQGPRPPDGDPEATITGFKAEIQSLDKVLLTFTLKKEPKTLFIQLMLDNWWWPFGNGQKASLLIPNVGQFHEGENQILLDKNNPESPWYAIAQHLEAESHYRINLAVNNDGLHWGVLSQVKFRLQVNQGSHARSSR